MKFEDELLYQIIRNFKLFYQTILSVTEYSVWDMRNPGKNVHGVNLNSINFQAEIIIILPNDNAPHFICNIIFCLGNARSWYESKGCLFNNMNNNIM